MGAFRQKLSVLNRTLNFPWSDLKKRVAEDRLPSGVIKAAVAKYHPDRREWDGSELTDNLACVLPRRPPMRKKVRPNEGISLGTAVAISGAAASPQMGHHSSPALAFLMSLFNVRLGWWLANPGHAGAGQYRSEGPSFALGPLMAEMFGLTTDNRAYVYLPDGGHFENLALYEMVRRRCRYIVVSDAGCDPGFAFEDLGNALRKDKDRPSCRYRLLPPRAASHAAEEGRVRSAVLLLPGNHQVRRRGRRGLQERHPPLRETRASRR